MVQSGSLRAGDGDRKLLEAERQVVAENAMWGAITSLNDGSLGLTIQRWRRGGGSPGPNVAIEWMRSTDGGQSWSDPVIVSERLGDGGLYYDVRPDDGYLVYEQRNQAIGQLPSGRLVCSMAELDYYYNSQGVAEQQNYLGSGFRYKDMVYTYSDDMGQTWEPVQTLPGGPFGGEHTYQPYIGASPHWRIINTEENGVSTAMMSLYGSLDPDYDGPLDIPAGTTYMAGVIRSTDNGATWGDISTIMTKSDGLPYEETALCVLSDGKLLAHTRTQAGNVVQYVSTDDGRNWSGPVPLTQSGQHPGGAFELDSGLVMATWGNRRDPYGAMGMMSYNGGVTWDYSHRVSLAWDGSGFGCGYANGAQAGDGSIVVTYYDSADGGKVYSVRFTEEQFLAASGGGPPDPPGGIAVDATFESGALPTDFGMTAGGNVDPLANVSGGKWINNLAAGEYSAWVSSELSYDIIGPKIHGLAQVGQATLTGNRDDQTLAALGTDVWGSFSFIISMNDGSIVVTGGGGASTYSTPVANQDAATHDYAWELDISTNHLKLFFDKIQVGDVEGYDMGGNFFGEELIYFGDGTGGTAHSEVWDRWLMAEGAYLPSVPGDANTDGIVDEADAAVLAANWLMPNGATWAHGDFNGDGCVNDADVTILAGNWQNAANASVPEPSALVLLAGCLFIFVLLRLRNLCACSMNLYNVV